MHVPAISLFQPTVVRKGKRTKTAVWWMAWREGGKRRTQSTGAKSRKAAQMVAADKQMEFACPRQPEPSEKHREMNWTRFVREFIDNYCAAKAPATLDMADTCIGIFTRRMQPKLLRDVDLPMLQAFVAARLREGVSPNTVDCNLRQLRCALNRAVDWGYLPAAPKFQSLWVGNDVGDRRVIPVEDIKRIMAALDDPAVACLKRDRQWWKAMLQAKLFLGARLGELLKLRWERVDFDAETITIFHDTSKGKRTRVYPNVGNLLSVLRPWHDAQTPTPEPADLVFPYDSDYRNIYADWRRILEHAGLPTDDRKRRHRLKDLRSTCATQLIEAGEPTLVVKDWLGHATVKTTESYYANTDKARKAAAGRRRVAG